MMPSAVGYTADIINLVTRNLEDRYENGFPVIKELIQNADDAKSKVFKFGISDGMDSAKHPLLKTRGLWIFNDGEFTAKDERAIRSFAENSKAGEAGTIGKFGLGMKSVYHLCEAFFYIAFDGCETKSTILNPWNYGDVELQVHPEWNHFDETDVSLLSEKVPNIYREKKSWMFIWLPLRAKAHILKNGRETGTIIPKFPGDSFSPELDFLGEEDLPTRISEVLPLLHHLQLVEFDSSHFPSFSVSLNSPHFEDGETAENKAGIVQITHANRSFLPLKFYGKRYQLENEVVRSLRAHTNWPKIRFRDEYGMQKEAPDKSKADGAVMLAMKPHESDNGTEVSIQWAVFLPLEEEELHYTASLPDGPNRKFSIILHNQFAIDAGRKGLFHYNSLGEVGDGITAELSNETIRKRWNQEVAQNGTLPLLPVVIAQLVQEHCLAPNEIASLIMGIKASKSKIAGSGSFSRKYLKFACQKYGFAKTISETRSEWQLVDINNSKLLTVPTSSNTAEPWRVFDVFPALRGSSFTLLSHSDDSLLPQDEYPILEDDYLSILNSLDSSFLKDEKTVKYLTEFFRIHSINGFSITLKHTIMNLIRKAFLKLDLADITANKKAVGELFTVISPKSFITLGTKDQTTSRGGWIKMWKVDSSILPLPNYFEGFTGDGTPRTDDVVEWIKAVGSSERAIIKDIRDRCIEDKQQFLMQHRDLPLIVARKSGEGDVLLSYNDIFELHTRRNLFRIDPSAQELLKDFKKVIPEEKLYTIAQQEFNLALPQEEIANRSNAPFAYSLAALGKELGTIEDRAKFVKQYTGAFNHTNDPEVKKGLRYLIHGDPAKIDDTSTPLWASTDTNSVWGKLRSLLFGANDSWTTLTPQIVKCIMPDDFAAVGIRTVNQQEIESDLSVEKIHSLNTIDFTTEEQEELLASINNDEKWRALPFHKTDSSELTSLDNSYFLNKKDIKYPNDSRLSDKVIALSHALMIKDKQERFIGNVLTIEDVIRSLLNTDRPDQHYHFIMKCLKTNSELTRLRELKEKKWLQLSNGKVTSPDAIIDFPHISDQLKQLCKMCEDIYRTSDSLLEGTELLKPLFSSEPSEYLPKISLMLNEIPEFTIGKLSNITQSEIKNSLYTLSKYEKLPGWGILASVVDQANSDASISALHNYFFPSLENELDQERILSTLNWILDEANDQTEVVYNLYLNELFSNNKVVEILHKIKLKSESGSWKNPAELCLPQEGYAKSYCLCKSQVPILRSHIEQSGETKSSVETGVISQEDLYLFSDNIEPIERWLETVSPGIVGLFLMFLGKSYQQLADKYLREDGRSLENAKKTLDWNSRGITLEEAFSSRVDIRIRWIGSNENCATTSLVGEPLIVHLQKNPPRLIVGTASLGKDRASHYDNATQTLNYILLDTLTSNNAEEQIKKTISYIYQDCFEQPSSGFESLWSEITEKKQLSVVVVRKTILEDIPTYLRQIGAASENVFKDYLSEIKRIRSKISEAEESKRDIGTADYKNQLSKIREELGELISKDENCQAIILDKVKKKIAEHQYQADGVPFEIFQNADDANVELEECEPVTQTPYFKVSTDSKLLCFEYSGRPVNYTGNNGREDFKYDLEKMLIIQASDKAVNEQVTGKFGLGFKSVFLISDTPRVRSGELDFSIAGGLLPIPAINPVRTPRKTAIELSINSDISTEEIIKRFKKLIPFSVVFSHRIKHVNVDDNNYQWAPREIHPSAVVGKSTIPLDSSHFIVFHTTKAKILFSLKGEGFDLQDRETPSVWVTAPLRDTTSFGFCVNASFQIDAGRGQLAGDQTENIRISTIIGNELGKILVEFLQSAQSNWPEYIEKLHLFENTSYEEFYTSLWIVLLGRWKNQDKSSQGFQIGRTISINALKVIVNTLGTLTNGFKDSHCKILPFRKDETYWEIPEKYYGDNSNNPEFINAIQSYSNVSIISNEMAYLIRQIFENMRVKELTVEELISFKMGHVYSPVDSAKIESVLKLIDVKQYGRSVFDGIKFHNQTGENEISTRLISLNNHANEEEINRASFAPETALLSNEYIGDALQFFIRVRGNLQATTEQLEKWMLFADSDEKKISSLRYILSGELSLPLSKKVRGQGWVKKLDNSLLTSFSPVERSELIRQLAEHVTEQPLGMPEPVITSEKLSLIKIHEWWETEGRGQYLTQYLSELYPDGDSPNLYDERGFPIDENWMQLFTLASFKRLGRIREFQTKGFLLYLKNHGWWDIICRNKPTESEHDWFSILKDYCNVKEEEYSFWMDSFHRIFKLREYLDRYVDIFENDHDASSISTYLAPNHSLDYQGSGLTAPSLEKTLKIGSSFIVRELFRNGVLKNTNLHQFAYMNTKGIRAVLDACGISISEHDTSCDIYESIANKIGGDATFANCFDIPLIIISRNTYLQQRFFEEHVTNQYWGENE